jgi:hypothetical protein
MMSSTVEDTVSDVLVLAAVDRAEGHGGRDTPGVPVWEALKHLDVPRRSKRARHVRARVDALEAAGMLARSRRHGVSVWAVTSAGRRRLARARHASESVHLPESPQHRRWRTARTAAGQEIERFRESLHKDLALAGGLLDAEPPPHSDQWFELAERLQRDCRQLGAASHCLYEWREPGEERADIDDHQEPGDQGLTEDEQAQWLARRSGRRNIRLWRDA